VYVKSRKKEKSSIGLRKEMGDKGGYARAQRSETCKKRGVVAPGAKHDRRHAPLGGELRHRALTPGISKVRGCWTGHEKRKRPSSRENPCKGLDAFEANAFKWGHEASDQNTKQLG